MTRRTAASRVLDVLGAFGPGHRTLSLSEIARRGELSLSTTHRLVGELLAWGALERGPDGRLSVGLRMLELSALAPRGLGLREVAFPHLDDLHRATGGNVHLGVRDGHEVVYVEALRSRHTAQVSSRVGDRWPLHATGTGVVLLAHADPADVDEVLARPLARYTARTRTDPALLRTCLAQVRRDGVAVLRGQITDDAMAVAVPVADRTGDVVAALSLVVHDDGSGPGELPALLTAVAARIRRALGAAGAGQPTAPAVGNAPVRPIERPLRAG
ncbi:IclR family transcriptional regulator [Actinomycetospora termitidis]|uniref:IclR family transcriptional regulator n=1 Tax=Actinomycetospora termitidis TaxID=3053470 RepID=A0ABT7M8Y5_9PSEU|nr:IclR family transcriptional regulator [Actinomycetospora sp. Odt1-22]MDL5157115.1 IclR family transcriptional regulator [Actinomycetospora sp. Odt1-22]